MRSVGEVGLQEDHSTEKYRDIIGSMLEEVARLTSMIDTLLSTAPKMPTYQSVSPSRMNRGRKRTISPLLCGVRSPNRERCGGV